MGAQRSWAAGRATRFSLAAMELLVLVAVVSVAGGLLTGAVRPPVGWLVGTPFTTWDVPADLLLAAVALPAGLAAALELTDHRAAPTATLALGLELLLVVAVQLVLLERYLLVQPLTLAVAGVVLAVSARRDRDGEG